MMPESQNVNGPDATYYGALAFQRGWVVKESIHMHNCVVT